VSSTPETGHVTGTKDKDYNHLVHRAVAEQRASPRGLHPGRGALGRHRVGGVFRRAQAASRKAGEQGRELLGKRLAA
jgi:hypothetical protein